VNIWTDWESRRCFEGQSQNQNLVVFFLFFWCIFISVYIYWSYLSLCFLLFAKLCRTNSETMKAQRRNYNIHENKDRLSNLSDCVLLHVLSILNSKEAVQTCILSTRWKRLWKHLPVLSLSSTHFKKNNFKGVTKFLSLRDDKTALQALNIHGHESIMGPRLLERIISYAVSHDVQLLQIYIKSDIQHFPSCLFSCHTLTSLNFCVSPRIYENYKIYFRIL
jgi:hypothetical protein